MNAGVGAEVITAAVAVLGVAAVVLRYAWRTLRSLEQVTATAARTTSALERHIEASDRLHQLMTDRIGEHAERLAVVETRTAHH